MVAIIAFGSLIDNPGDELSAAITEKRPVRTPFSVEYARLSNSRGGAPTLVPVETCGAAVNAMLLVLRDHVSVARAKDMLWRRETKQVGSDKQYRELKKPTANTVLIKELIEFEGVELVLYVDFPPVGKLQTPTAYELASAAANSARVLATDEDGITYLRNAMAAGVETPLTTGYEQAILELTNASSLEEAREKLRAG